jgi:hypothetical protein
VRGAELEEEEEALEHLVLLLNGRERKHDTARLPLLELDEASATLVELEATADAEAEADGRHAAALLREDPMDVMRSVWCYNE